MDDGRISPKGTERPAEERRASVQRKPVSATSLPEHDELFYSVRTRSNKHRGIVSDGESRNPRLSTLSGPGVDAAIVSPFSSNTQRRGSNFRNSAISPISEHGTGSNFRDSPISPVSERRGAIGSHAFPMLEISAEEAAQRRSVVPSLVLSTTTGISQNATRGSTPTFRENAPMGDLIGRDSSSLHVPERPCDWLPISLRSAYIIILLVVTITLGGLVLGLTIKSDRNRGLGTNHGTLGVLFGWRFLPTLFAVLYMLLVRPIMNDVKRTEPFARLSSFNGTSASAGLFMKARVTWVDPFLALSKKRNGGFRSWALFWASLLNVMGFFLVLPFSSALLFPTGANIGKNTTFSQLNILSSSSLKLSTNIPAYSRTISSALFNITTSAWLNNNYTIVPFWPSSLKNPPTGTVLSSVAQQWIGSTTIFQVSLDCSAMDLKSAMNYSINATQIIEEDTITWMPTNLTSFVLESPDQCSLGVSALTSADTNNSIWATGGAWWATASNGTIGDLSADRPVFFNTSSQCGNRTMILLVAPEEYGQINAQGYICSSDYFSANIPVTVTNTGSASNITFDTNAFDKAKKRIDSSVLNISSFENAFLGQNWSTQLQLPKALPNFTQAIPDLAGPLLLMASKNNFNIKTVMANPNFVDQARQIKQRFLGESMQSTFNHMGSQQATTIPGNIAVMEERIVISFSIGILLTTALFISSFMICFVAFYTRLERRPLNLYEDPASTNAIASLIRYSAKTRALFEGLDQCSEADMKRQLDGYTFALRSGVLWSYDLRDAYQQQGEISSLNVSSHAASSYSFGLVPSEHDTKTKYCSSNSRDIPPTPLRIWFLLPAFFFLLALLIVLVLLFAIFRNKGVLQEFQAPLLSLNHFRPPLEAGAGYSIISTLVGIGVNLWWSSIDRDFRRLQPYISMMQKPTLAKKGTALSYITSPVAWTVGKASMNKHWFLAIVATGTVLSEILIVSMSGLWVPRLATQSRNTTLPQQLEIRNSPFTFEIPSTIQKPTDVLSYVYGNLPAISMSSTINNTAQAPWTSGDWSFIPVDLTSIRGSSSSLTPPTNITLTTPSIRSHLQCTAIDMTSASSWLTAIDFTNDTKVPCNLTTGYELNLPFSSTTYINETSNTYIQFLTSENCNSISNSSLVSWSPDTSNPDKNIIVTSTTGSPFLLASSGTTQLIYPYIPGITAVNCTPIFETSVAKITIDASTGVVGHYTISGSPQTDTNAWVDQFVGTNATSKFPSAQDSAESVRNISVSYGPLATKLIAAFPFPFANNSTLSDPTLLANASSNLFSNLVHAFALNPISETLTPSIQQSSPTNSLLYQPHSTSEKVSSLITSPSILLRPLRGAFIFSLVILVFLLLLILCILLLGRKDIEKLSRDIDTLGSVLGFLYASDRFLASLPDHPYRPPSNSSSSDPYQYQPEYQYQTRYQPPVPGQNQESSFVSLGPFTTTSGHFRWGIELNSTSSPQENKPLPPLPPPHLPTPVSVSPFDITSAPPPSFPIPDPLRANPSPHSRISNPYLTPNAPLPMNTNTLPPSSTSIRESGNENRRSLAPFILPSTFSPQSIHDRNAWSMATNPGSAPLSTTPTDRTTSSGSPNETTPTPPAARRSPPTTSLPRLDTSINRVALHPVIKSVSLKTTPKQPPTSPPPHLTSTFSPPMTFPASPRILAPTTQPLTVSTASTITSSPHLGSLQTERQATRARARTRAPTDPPSPILEYPILSPLSAPSAEDGPLSATLFPRRKFPSNPAYPIPIATNQNVNTNMNTSRHIGGLYDPSRGVPPGEGGITSRYIGRRRATEGESERDRNRGRNSDPHSKHGLAERWA